MYKRNKNKLLTDNFSRPHTACARERKSRYGDVREKRSEREETRGEEQFCDGNAENAPLSPRPVSRLETAKSESGDVERNMAVGEVGPGNKMAAGGKLGDGKPRAAIDPRRARARNPTVPRARASRLDNGILKSQTLRH